MASVFLILSIFRSVLELFADLAGIHYAPAALLLVLLLGCFAILIHYSEIISKISEQNKILIQEVALLKQNVQFFKALYFLLAKNSLYATPDEPPATPTQSPLEITRVFLMVMFSDIIITHPIAYVSFIN